MGKKIHIKNLSLSMNDKKLLNLFIPFGIVESAKVITDCETGRSKGFGYVKMSSATSASDAIKHLNGINIENRIILVTKIRSTKPRENDISSKNGL